MSSFNRTILMGNLTRDPDVRYTSNNTAIVAFSLAVSRRFKVGDGEWQQETSFIDCTIWGKRGEAFAKFHKKGKPALIEGYLKQETWDDKKTGAKRSKVGVVCENWEFVGGGNSSRDDNSSSPDAYSFPGETYPIGDAGRSDRDDAPF